MPESNNDFSPILKEMGLSTYESRVWEALLRRGQADAQMLTKEAGVPFGRIYDVLNDLVRKRIVEVQNTRPKLYRPKKTKEIFDRLIDSKKKEMDAKLHQLEEAAESLKKKFEHVDKTLPKDEVFVSVALGYEEIKELMRDAEYSADNEILIAMAPIDVPQKLRHVVEENARLLADKASHGVSVKLMFVEYMSPSFRIFGSMAEKTTNGLFQVRTYSGKVNFFKVIDRKYVLFEITDPFEPEPRIALIKLYSKKLAEHMSQVFLRCWRNSRSVQQVEARVLASR